MVCVCVCVQKRPMQTDGWPEMDEVKHPDMINEQDLLEAKAVILNWIKDLRAQPEVGNVQITLPVQLTPLNTGICAQYTCFIHTDHPAAKRVAWGACCKGPGRPAVSLALGPSTQSADSHGAGYVDFDSAAPR